MDTVQTWLATTPLGGIVKVLIGTLLGYVAAELPSWGPGWPAIIFLVVQALTPVIINYVNRADSRYGRTRGGA